MNRLFERLGNRHLIHLLLLELLSLFHSYFLFNVSYFKVPWILTKLLYSSLNVLHSKVSTCFITCFESLKDLSDFFDLLWVQVVIVLAALWWTTKNVALMLRHSWYFRAITLFGSAFSLSLSFSCFSFRLFFFHSFNVCVVVFPDFVLCWLVILIELAEVETFAECIECFVWIVLPPL